MTESSTSSAAPTTRRGTDAQVITEPWRGVGANLGLRAQSVEQFPRIRLIIALGAQVSIEGIDRIAAEKLGKQLDVGIRSIEDVEPADGAVYGDDGSGFALGRRAAH